MASKIKDLILSAATTAGWDISDGRKLDYVIVHGADGQAVKITERGEITIFSEITGTLHVDVTTALAFITGTLDLNNVPTIRDTPPMVVPDITLRSVPVPIVKVAPVHAPLSAPVVTVPTVKAAKKAKKAKKAVTPAGTRTRYPVMASGGKTITGETTGTWAIAPVRAGEFYGAWAVTPERVELVRGYVARNIMGSRDANGRNSATQFVKAGARANGTRITPDMAEDAAQEALLILNRWITTGAYSRRVASLIEKANASGKREDAERAEKILCGSAARDGIRVITNANPLTADGKREGAFRAQNVSHVWVKAHTDGDGVKHDGAWAPRPLTYTDRNGKTIMGGNGMKLKRAKASKGLFVSDSGVIGVGADVDVITRVALTARDEKGKLKFPTIAQWILDVNITSISTREYGYASPKTRTSVRTKMQAEYADILAMLPGRTVADVPANENMMLAR